MNFCSISQSEQSNAYSLSGTSADLLLCHPMTGDRKNESVLVAPALGLCWTKVAGLLLGSMCLLIK